MTEVIAPGYRGPERRKTFVVTDTCPCHTKHDAILRRHDDELKAIRREDMGTMWEDIKSRTPLKIFLLAVLIFVGVAGVTYKKAHDIDIKVEKNVTKMENMEGTLVEIKRGIEKMRDQLADHVIEWRKTNGNSHDKEGDTR